MEPENNLGQEDVPRQQTGSKMNAVEKKVMNSEAEAKLFFTTVKERLLDVNNWAEIADVPMSTFKLTDSLGNEVDRMVTEGDYLKIDIPGPGTKIGDGYDWVLIEEVKEETKEGSELLSMRARPASNPMNNDENIAHFLTDQATSTFQVKRVGNTIYAEEHGRNEVTNTKTGRTLDNLRNTLVGWSARIGLSYPQWKGLVAGFLDQKSPIH